MLGICSWSLRFFRIIFTAGGMSVLQNVLDLQLSNALHSKDFTVKANWNFDITHVIR
jgi:hypothetical protein